MKDAAKKTPKTMAAMTVLQIERDIKRVPPPKSTAAMGAHTRNRTQGGCSASRSLIYDEYGEPRRSPVRASIRSATADASDAGGAVVQNITVSNLEPSNDTKGERTALQRASSRANGIKFGRPRKAVDAEHITPSKGRWSLGARSATGPQVRPEMTVEIWAFVVLVA